jgi:hypothetical protein
VRTSAAELAHELDDSTVQTIDVASVAVLGWMPTALALLCHERWARLRGTAVKA